LSHSPRSSGSSGTESRARTKAVIRRTENKTPATAAARGVRKCSTVIDFGMECMAASLTSRHRQAHGRIERRTRSARMVAGDPYRAVPSCKSNAVHYSGDNCGGSVHSVIKEYPTANMVGPTKIPSRPKAATPPSMPSRIGSIGRLLSRLIR
jgi:hypothetical protein